MGRILVIHVTPLTVEGGVTNTFSLIDRIFPVRAELPQEADVAADAGGIPAVLLDTTA